MIDTSRIPGYGSDADPSRRPGFPKERKGRMLPVSEIPQQRADVKVFVNDRPHKSLPPVFGTAQPPRGLAGKVRRIAYGYPAHWTRHWLLLLFADRVDVLEHRWKGKNAFVTVGAIGALALAGGATLALLGGRRRAHS